MIAALALLGVATGVVAPAAQAIPQQCQIREGKPLSVEPWAQKTLDLTALQNLSDGRYTVTGRDNWGRRVSVGEPVSIAIIDSGFDPRNPVFEGIDVASPEHHEIRAIPGVYDCAGHGTWVTSIIAAQPGSTPMSGIAPRAHIVPIVYTDSEDGGPSAPVLVAALKYAIAQHVQIINLSLQATATTPAVVAVLRQAERDGIVVVVAGGNVESQGSGPYYPAALSPKFDNIIAVDAVGKDGSAGNVNYGGSYIDVAAPGIGVSVANRLSGFDTQNGTSFAAPVVSGVVALMLATHPGMSPQTVRNRLEATADPPPGSQPNSIYGYGTVNPLLAITSVQDISSPDSAPGGGGQVAAPGPAVGPDRTLEHRALAVAVVLLGLAALTVVASAVVRGSRRAHVRPE